MAISLLVLGGCGASTPTVNNVAPAAPSATSTPVADAPKTATLGTTLKDLLNGGKDQKCTWVASDDATRNGILYISGKKFRQDTSMTDVKTKKVGQLFAISDGASIYSWGSVMGGNRGVKTSLTELESMISGTPTGGPVRSSIDMNKQYQYQCEPWTVDATLFVPPTTVNFTDMSKQLEQLNQMKKKLGGQFDIPSIPTEK